MTVRVLIVIGDVLQEPWHSISLQGQMKTWLMDADPRVQIRHSHARKLGTFGRWFDRTHEWARWHPRLHGVIPSVDRVLGRPFRKWTPPVSHVNWGGQPGWAQAMPDLFALQRWKVVTSFTQCLHVPEWKHVYFTTASSYVRIQALLDRIGDLPETGAFAGTLMVEGTTGEEFASGANRAFSRDIVEAVVEERGRYSNDVMEDVGVSRLIRELGVDLIPWPSLNVSSHHELESVSDDALRMQHHFRLRSEIQGQRNDIALMHALHTRCLSLDFI